MNPSGSSQSSATVAWSSKLPPVQLGATTPIPKVLAYITRERARGREVLVFRHQHAPDAGCQVPGGTVEAGEDLIAAVQREVREEAGLVGLEVVAKLATASFVADWRGELQERNVFHLRAAHDLPNSWDHVVQGGEEDAGLVFEFFWLSLADAERRLRWGQGSWLGMLEGEPAPRGSG